MSSISFGLQFLMSIVFKTTIIIIIPFTQSWLHKTRSKHRACFLPQTISSIALTNHREGEGSSVGYAQNLLKEAPKRHIIKMTDPQLQLLGVRNFTFQVLLSPFDNDAITAQDYHLLFFLQLQTGGGLVCDPRPASLVFCYLLCSFCSQTKLVQGHQINDSSPHLCIKLREFAKEKQI